MSVHRMPPQDEPFDPRLAALSHAGMAEEMATSGPGAPGPRTVARIAGELASAIACGLVYVGDRIDDAARERPVALQLVLPNAEAVAQWKLMEETADRRAEPGPTFAEQRPAMRSQATRVLWDKREMMPEHSEEIVEDVLDVVEKLLNGRVPESGPTPTDSWREFLRDQAAQIPEGIEFALRELLSQLEGQSLEFEVREPVQSLTDWLNQLSNVRQEVADGRAGE